MSLSDLGRRLEKLEELAHAAGADPAWLAETIGALFRALVDPRRKRTLGLALRVAKARAAGVGIAELVERFGRSRPQIYRYLAAVSSSRETEP
jgi:hypothetical protein